MINFNGNLFDSKVNILQNNRAFLYGDGVFETLKVVNSKILFFEDHYFRLMASMRILRMEIPMNFSMEFLENEILQTVKLNHCECSARIRLTIYRNAGGYYLPITNSISFVIDAKALDHELYQLNIGHYEVELYKDFYVPKNLLSTLKSTNKLINITGSIFANENGYQNCLLINETKNVVEALNGNLFMVVGNKLITPPLSEGCLNGIIRKKILEIAKKDSQFEVLELPISPFELQKADELLITNCITGIQSITKYRKKDFVNTVALQFLEKLNVLIKEV